VVGGDASYACPDWPLCQGRLLPLTGVGLPVLIHFFHRGMVALVSILIAVTVVRALRRWRAIRGVAVWAALLGIFFTAQVLVGAVQVWLVLPAALLLTLGVEQAAPGGVDPALNHRWKRADSAPIH
jgi:cytochrome c oxidase assembly protein subunit 15